MNKLIYLSDNIESTLGRLLSDRELQDLGLDEEKVKLTLENFFGDEIATSVFLKKYALRNSNNKIIEFTLNEAKNRWAKAISVAEKMFDKSQTKRKTKKYFRELYNYFLPAGRQMFALGNDYIKNATFTNCYVTSTGDSIEEIFNTGYKIAKTFSYGGGQGIDIGPLRPQDAKVSNSAKFSTGAVSFVDLFSFITGLIGQHGRRGALMITIPVNHPDIELFIDVKNQDDGKVRFANISIKLTDDFMNAVIADKEFKLSFETKHEVIEHTVNAKDLWTKIVKAAHSSAEPGVMFWDRAVEMSPSDTYEDMKIIGSNPCLTGDTKVYVADGRGYVSIKKLADEGKDVPVFTLDNNKKQVIRMMRNPRKTGVMEPVFKVILNNGFSFSVTENHEIYLSNGKVEIIKNLKPGDNLIGLSTEGIKIKGEFYQNLFRLKSKLINSFSDKIQYKIINGNKIFIKKCEICNILFKTKNREVSICSQKCHNEFVKNRGLNFKKDERFQINSIEFVGCEDVYNGTVDEFHRFFFGGFKQGLRFNSVLGGNCGEQLLSAEDSCNLGSLLLPNFVENSFSEEAKFNFNLFRKMIKGSVRHLDNIIELNIGRHALKEQEEASLRGRRIGLGFTGLADCFAALNIKYDSDEAIKFAEKLGKIKKEAEYKASIMLARDRGAFPVFDANKHYERGFCKLLPKNIKDLGKKYGQRNVAISTLAPSGSLSIIAQCSSGIEPIFAHSYKRFVELGQIRKEFTVFHQGVSRYLDFIGKANQKNVTLPPLWVTSHDIDYQFRIKLQGALQKQIDASISSTINLPNDVSVDVVSDVYLNAWKKGLKGVTVYREGSREGILITDDYSQEVTGPNLDTIVYNVHAEGGDKFYIPVSYRNKDIRQPYQVFVMNYKTAEKDRFSQLAKELKAMLQKNGVDSERIKKYSKRASNTLTRLTRFLSLSFKTNNFENACEILEEHAYAGTLAAELYKIFTKSMDEKNALCKNCGGSNIRMEESCIRCLDCGWSACG